MNGVDNIDDNYLYRFNAEDTIKGRLVTDHEKSLVGAKVTWRSFEGATFLYGNRCWNEGIIDGDQ
jgi:hypothetical protein